MCVKDWNNWPVYEAKRLLFKCVLKYKKKKDFSLETYSRGPNKGTGPNKRTGWKTC